MSDIVERLREPPPDLREHDATYHVHQYRLGLIAADEIERLRAALKGAEARAKYYADDAATAWDRCEVLRNTLTSAGYIFQAEGLDTAFIENALGDTPAC